MHYLTILILSTTSLLLASCENVTAPKPDQVIELFRHGARGPLHDYDDTWPDNLWALLTPVGMRQQYILGKVLAEKYPNIFGSTYDYTKIYMLSDQTDRCVQSAYAQLYGMYIGKGPGLRPDYPGDLAVPPFKDDRVEAIAKILPNSQAVPDNFVPTIVDIVDDKSVYIFQGDVGYLCPNMHDWDRVNYNDSRAQKAWEIFSETITNVNKLLPKDKQLKAPIDVADFGDSVYVNYYENKTLPGGLKDPALLFNITMAYTWFSFHIWEGLDIQGELGAYNQVAEILNQLANFRKGNDYYTAALYAGHDDNLYAMLKAFGLVTEECIMENFVAYNKNGTIPNHHCLYPFFASSIVIELYNSTISPYVKFYYNNIELPICGGKYSCPYDEFVVYANSAVGNNTFESYLKKCGAKKSDDQVSMKTKFGASGSKLEHDYLRYLHSGEGKVNYELVAFVGLSLLALFLVVKISLNRKRYEKLVKESRSDADYNQIPELTTE